MQWILKAFLALHRFVYRVTGGAIGGRMGRAPVLLLTTMGRKTGKPRTTPLLYLEDEGPLVVVASNGGADRHPAWYLNLQNNPVATVQIRRETKTVRARRASPEEKARLWSRLTSMYDGYEGYQRRTHRQIPLVILDPQ